MNMNDKRDGYDKLIEDLKRESELSSCSSCQREANAHKIHLLNMLKNKRTSDSPTHTTNLDIELMAKRAADPTYRFSPWSLLDE